MEWIAPLTILPAIGLIILSTSNFIVALNNEIYNLQIDESRKKILDTIIQAKLKQLTRLGFANAFLYAAALCLLLSSLVRIFFERAYVFQSVMVFSTVLITAALVFLFIHSLKAIQIRNQHLTFPL